MIEARYTPEEMIEKIQSGAITIQYEPVFSMYPRGRIYDAVLQGFRDAIEDNEWCKTLSPGEMKHWDNNILVVSDDTHPHLLCHNISYLKIYHGYLNDDISLSLIDNVITFCVFEASQSVPGHKTVSRYVEPDVTGWNLPITWEINIPSRKVLFVNFFRHINPSPPDKYAKKWSINGTVGIRNTAQYYAEHNNVGYGQMGNMSVAIFSNDTEILVIEPWFSDIIESYEYVDEDCPSETPAESDTIQYNHAKDLQRYLIDHQLIFRGEISMCVWRYECTDYEQGKEEIPELHQDMAAFEIPGTKLIGTHYYQTHAIDPELGSLCYARIQIL